MKNTIRRIITAAMAASMLTLTANAYTIPEYSFDITQYQCKSCSICNEFSAPVVPDSEIAPNCVMIVLKGEYSYINSVWTVEDFPELAEAGLSVEGVTDLTRFDKDDEWIESYLSRVDFHQILSVDLGTYNYEKVHQVRDAIVEATLAGNHPEFALVEFNVVFYEETQVGDTNGDGLIDAIDSTLVLRYVIGDDVAAGFRCSSADVNSDGSVDAIDATLITRYAVGSIDSFL